MYLHSLSYLFPIENCKFVTDIFKTEFKTMLWDIGRPFFDNVRETVLLVVHLSDQTKIIVTHTGEIGAATQTEHWFVNDTSVYDLYLQAVMQ